MVIAIIAILASLLLPALSRAKTLAKDAQGKNNLRQIGIGLIVYVQDFSAYPMGWEDRPGTWRRALREYSNTPVIWKNLQGTRAVVFKKEGIFRCPAVTTNRSNLFPGVTWQSYEGDRFWEHYAYNENGSGNLNSSSGLAGKDWVNGRHTVRTREDDVKVPSDMMAMGDAIYGWERGKFLQRFFTIGRDGHSGVDEEETRRIRRQHRGRTTVVFCDGHVEAIELDKLYKDTSADWLRRWNRDNEPHQEYHDYNRKP